MKAENGSLLCFDNQTLLAFLEMIIIDNQEVFASSDCLPI